MPNSMTRQHFASIAQAIKDTKFASMADRAACAVLMAQQVGQYHTQFDKAKFMKACGVIGFDVVV